MKWETIEQRREYYRKWREKNREKRKVYEREYRLRHHSKCIFYDKEYKKNHKNEIRAQKMARWRVKTGKIIKTPCIICGNKKSEMHHQNYDKPLEIIWLCHSCHRRLHIGQLVEEINNYLKVEQKLKSKNYE